MNNPSSSNQELETSARRIKETPLFTGPSDLDRLFYKQQLFLVVAGLKPAAQLASGHWQSVSDTERVTVPDDEAEVRQFLDDLGLVYSITRDDHALDCFVARKPEQLDALLHAKGNESWLAMGYPHTVVQALAAPGREGLLEDEERIALADETYHDPSFTQFSLFGVASKAHAKEELMIVKSWYDALKAHDLVN